MSGRIRHVRGLKRWRQRHYRSNRGIGIVTAAQQQQILCIVDRAEAIRTACQLAQPHDIILIAGKGHETYQEIRGQRYAFDDWEILKHNIR